MEEVRVMQVAPEGGDPGGGSGEVVQVIMQEDGQIVMPEGQFIQVNTDDGQPQFIQVTDDNGENQFIQLLPDGQAHFVQVQEDHEGNTHIIQMAPGSMDLGNNQGALTIVNVDEAPPSDISQHNQEAEQEMHLQVSSLEDPNSQPEMKALVIEPTESDSTTVDPSHEQMATHEEEHEQLIEEAPSDSAENIESGVTKDVKDFDELEPDSVVTPRSKNARTGRKPTVITIHPPVVSSAHNNDSGVVTTVHTGLPGVVARVHSTLSGGVTTTHEAIPGVVNSVQETISGVGSSAQEGVPGIETSEYSTLPGVVNTEQEATSGVTIEEQQSETSEHNGMSGVVMNTQEDPGVVIREHQDMHGVVTMVVESPSEVERPMARSNPVIKTPPKTKKLDMTSPITLTTDTVVVVNGKRCVLRVDPQSSNLVAYPFTPTPLPGKRGRGRPRKMRPIEGVPPRLAPMPVTPSTGSQDSMKSQDSSDGNQSASESIFDTPTTTPTATPSATPTKKGFLSEQENSAAEGLLGLSEDGVRRSRRKRKRATFLSDYETGAVEGVVEDEEEDSKEGILEGVKRPRGRAPGTISPKAPVTTANNAMQTLLMNMGIIPKKRGRGRPRRNPLPTSVPSSTGPIPAFIIPQPGGNAVMMAPIQNMDGLQRSLVTIKAKPPQMVLDKAETPTSIVIQNADGSKTQIEAPIETLHSQPEIQDEVTETVEMPETVAVTTAVTMVTTTEGESEGSFVKAVNGADDKAVNSKPVTDIIDSGALDDDVADPDFDPEGHEEEEDDDQVDKDMVEKKAKMSSPSSMPPAAIIQLPDNLVPLLLPKKTPVKIGLKATESDLEKLKCPKCDFQAYYQQQFQEHIGTHIDDIHKCKCCNFLTFDQDGLLNHFREAHPKCICSVCDFMAEHAYIIKRHMMRHNANGCECNLCGKRYKDQYILKMHIKMVHMPAEVLYECQVCSKKFTRKAHLKRHLRIHEPEKPYKCSHCDYRGCERSDITKHLLIHEEPRHICEVCGKAFRHIKNKELHVKRHKGQRDYKCGVCDFYGYTFTDIRKHIERKHSDARNILCDKCGSAFKNDTLLREHQKRQCELLMFEASLPVEEEAADGSQQTIQLVEEGGHLQQHHTIQLPSDQFQVVDGSGGGGQQQQQQHIIVNGNPVNITVEQVEMPDSHQQLTIQQVAEQLVVEQLDSLEGLTQGDEQLGQAGTAGGSGEVTVVHMDDVARAAEEDEELEEDEDLEEEEELEEEELEEDLVAEEQMAIQEEIAVEPHVIEPQVVEQVVPAEMVATMEEVADTHIISVDPGEVGETQEQHLTTEVVELSAVEQEVQQQVVVEQQVIEQQVVEHQVMEEQVMEQQAIDDDAIGEQLLIELVQ